jgi:hypothetical protein
MLTEFQNFSLIIFVSILIFKLTFITESLTYLNYSLILIDFLFLFRASVWEPFVEKWIPQVIVNRHQIAEQKSQSNLLQQNNNQVEWQTKYHIEVFHIYYVH